MAYKDKRMWYVISIKVYFETQYIPLTIIPIKSGELHSAVMAKSWCQVPIQSLFAV